MILKHIARAAFAILAVACLVGSTCTNTGANNTGDPNFTFGDTGFGNSAAGGQNSNGAGPVVLGDDHVLGSANAPVTVIEYADFQCPCCGRFAREDFPTIKANYIDTGKVRWVFRHFPLTNIHPRAQPAAEASECAADQVDFFAYADLTFNTVDGAGAAILTDAQLLQNATNLGANAATFNACVAGDSKTDGIQQDFNAGVALGVTGTPVFFVDAEKFPPTGSTSCPRAADLAAVIDDHLAN